MKTGWYSGISNDHYHLVPGISSTNIGQLCKSGQHYYQNKSSIDPDVSNLGNHLHFALLEPEKLKKNIIRPPKGNRATSKVQEKWIEFWHEQDERGALRIPVDQAISLPAQEHYSAYSLDYFCITGKHQEIIDNLMINLENYPYYKDLLYSGENELSGFAWVTVNGQRILLKIRPDVKNKDEEFILDVKSCSQIEKFMRIIYEKNYHIQRANYSNVANHLDGGCYKKFYWLVFETSPPYQIVLFHSDDQDDIHRDGLDLVHKGLETYAECKKVNKWPGYQEFSRKVYRPFESCKSIFQ